MKVSELKKALEELSPVVQEFLEMNNPVQVQDEIIDVKTLTHLVGDGSFSDDQVMYYHTPDLRIVKYSSSNWQGSINSYKFIALSQFVEDCTGWEDSRHSSRFLRALQSYITLLLEAQS